MPESSGKASQRLGKLIAWTASVRGGVVVAVTIALAASFLSDHYGAPAMLFALLIGMAFNFLSATPSMAPGVAFGSRTLLRIGVALLGLRLTFEDVSALGTLPIVAVAGLLFVSICVGILMARAFGYSSAFGLLSAGAVAICGASAALAIAVVLTARRVREEDLLLTIVAVTALSTVAMVVYPVLFTALGLSAVQSGYLVGATIHDVAQVVGAGYSISEEAGDIATFTKLFRVALLPVVLILAGVAFHGGSGGRVSLPWFVVAFVLLMALRNFLPPPEQVLTMLNDLSRFVLLTAISALGMKTALGEMLSAGPRRFLLITMQTMLLLLMALGLVYFNIV